MNDTETLELGIFLDVVRDFDNDEVERARDAKVRELLSRGDIRGASEIYSLFN